MLPHFVSYSVITSEVKIYIQHLLSSFEDDQNETKEGRKCEPTLILALGLFTDLQHSVREEKLSIQFGPSVGYSARIFMDSLSSFKKICR